MIDWSWGRGLDFAGGSGGKEGVVWENHRKILRKLLKNIL